MAPVEPRDPFRTTSGFYPISDIDSGGLSDPAFERHYAALPDLDDFEGQSTTLSPAKLVQLVASIAGAMLIAALLFFPEAITATVAR